MTLCFTKTDHCTRCSEPFAPDETAYIVRESVVWRTSLQQGLALTAPATVPVCAACLTPQERNRPRQPVPCLGCDRTLAITAGCVAVYCSSRCKQRVARRRRRERARRRCESCNAVFTPARADARYCSQACRQWAYRTRRAEAPAGTGAGQTKHGVI